MYTNLLKAEITDIIIVASNKELNWKDIDRKKFSPSAIHIGWIDEFLSKPFVKMEKEFKNGLVLTDDKPLLDYLSAETVLQWRINANNEVSMKQLMQKKQVYY